ncbi:hypothetical protein AVEN_15236-1 [Araneus ventricosus]|uniref:Uncharacterized protein n=1 Tax=Araneus ventricosus TaxID=182803 RepID=A0A4Y2UVD9_ARAVE|nr:hypothetical protein AVEN_15236-1 [Araneus ventricosus]
MVKSNTRRYNGKPIVESKMKISKTKSLVRRNKYSSSVNAIEKSHFWNSVISEEKGNEALDSILQANFQESGNKVLSIKTEFDVDKKFLEDVEFGSETEEESQTSFRENTLTVEDELIPDYEIPVSANRLNSSAQKKLNINSVYKEISNESQLFSVNRKNDESQIEMRIEHEDIDEILQLDKENLLIEVKTLPHSLVSDVEDNRKKFKFPNGREFSYRKYREKD